MIENLMNIFVEALQSWILSHEDFLQLFTTSGFDTFSQTLLMLGTIIITLIAFIMSFLSFRSNKLTIRERNLNSEIDTLKDSLTFFYLPLFNLSYHMLVKLNTLDIENKSDSKFDPSLCADIDNFEHIDIINDIGNEFESQLNNFNKIVREYAYLGSEEAIRDVVKFIMDVNFLQVLLINGNCVNDKIQNAYSIYSEVFSAKTNQHGKLAVNLFKEYFSSFGEEITLQSVKEVCINDLNKIYFKTELTISSVNQQIISRKKKILSLRKFFL